MMTNEVVSAMRSTAQGLFAAGVEAADPRLAVRKAITSIDLQPPANGRLYVVAVGKAAVPMMMEIQSLVPSPPDISIVVTNYDNVATLEGVEVYGSGHPVPDENGAKAGAKIAALMQELTANDIVLCLISGGGSALLPAPVSGISLADKIAVSELLLKSGCDITQMNLVRQNLSQLKGGGLARLARPAKVISLILSDVPGDDLSIIASGPTAPPFGGRKQARQLIENRGLWDKLPQSVQQILSGPQAAPGNFDHVANHLIGSNKLSVAAAIAATTGYECHLLDSWLDGDVADAAAKIFAAGHNAASPPQAIFCGGETTVNVVGTGKGGRNQEMALRFASLAEQNNFSRDWVFLSAGTDGRDGPTDAAGGIVDAGTLGRIADSGCDLEALLANNDAYVALQAANDLLMTGATGTNVADLQILLLA